MWKQHFAYFLSVLVFVNCTEDLKVETLHICIKVLSLSFEHWKQGIMLVCWDFLACKDTYVI